MTPQTVAVIGTGYVGLVSGVCLAAKGHQVTCVDTNPEIVERIRTGRPHIYEEGLDTLLAGALATGKLRATTNLAEAMAGADGVLLAVGTPTTGGQIDLRFVEAAAAGIGAQMAKSERPCAVIVKSTVLPGVTDTFVRGILEKHSGKQLGAFGLGMNPEFLREGNAVSDFMEPDRIVLGFEDERARDFLEALYAPWTCEKLRVNSRTAELIKYANNALLATQISAINEIANIAHAAGGIDIMDVVQGVHLDKRWNPRVAGERVKPGILSYLIPGCGFGGSCFPKDVQALRGYGGKVAARTPILDAVLAVNENQPGEVTRILDGHVPDLSRQTVLVLGLAFKPNTDDVRETPALRILADLLPRAGRLLAHDPKATDNFRRALGPLSARVEFIEDWQAGVRGAAVVVVITAWPEYAELRNLELKDKVVFDARRMFTPHELPGARYLAIGRSRL